MERAKRKVLFLVAPHSSPSLIYHLGVFLYLFILVVLEDIERSELEWRIRARYGYTFHNVHQWFHKVGSFFLVYLPVEFVLCVWASTLYLPLSDRTQWTKITEALKRLTDILIYILLLDLLFLQNLRSMHPLLFLRIFRFDSYVNSMALIKKIVLNCGKYLVSVYFCTFILNLLHAFLIFESEEFFRAETEADADEITTVGESVWYSVITTMGVGYGDKVVKNGFSRVITVFLGVGGWIIFFSSTTLVSLAITSQAEEKEVRRRNNKKRISAARIIQNWFRYMKTSERHSCVHDHNRNVCFRLQDAKQQILRMWKESGHRMSSRISHKVKSTHESYKKLYKKRKSLPNIKAGITTAPVSSPSIAQRKRSRSLDLTGKVGFLIKESAKDTRITSRRNSLKDSVRFYLYDDAGADAVREFRSLLTFVYFLIARHHMRKFKKLRMPLDALESHLMEKDVVYKNQIREFEERIDSLLFALGEKKVKGDVETMLVQVRQLTDQLDKLQYLTRDREMTQRHRDTLP